MKRNLLILPFIAFIITACKNSVSKQKDPPEKVDSNLTMKDTLPNPFDVMEELTAQFENKVQLDTFINYITNQNNLKFVARLYESSIDNPRKVTYTGGGYSFELEVDTNQRTTFRDGKTIIKFSDHSITCSDVYYWCNGVGCGCNLTFIYDLETKKATFLENYRVPYEGSYISDFDNDAVPDLLVISKHVGETIQKKGLRFDEFRVKLSWFYYDNGKFRLKKETTSKRSKSIELYSFVPDYNQTNHHSSVYSITKDNWSK